MHEHSVGLTLVKLGLHPPATHWVLSVEQSWHFMTSHCSQIGGVVEPFSLKPLAGQEHSVGLILEKVG